MDINLLIRTELIKHDMTIGELVQKLGCSRQALGVRLRRNDMKVSTLEQIAELLDCQLNISFSPKL